MSRNATRLVGVFIIACVLFNFPLLGIFAKPHWFLGIPMPVFYLFAVWLGMIILVWRLADGKNPFKKNEP
jgi:hypothetical protein